MGLTPITNLIALPETRAVQLAMGPEPMKPVANSSRTEDESYSPSDEASSRDSEEESAEEHLESSHEEGEPEPEHWLAQDADTSQISFFA